MGIDISKRLVAVNSASTVIRTVISLTVVFWVQRILLNAVDAEEYKVLALVSPLMLFVPLFTMWFGGGISRYVIEAYAKGDKKRVTEITSTMAPLCWAAAVGIVAVGSVLTWKIRFVLDLDPSYERDAQIMFGILVLQAAMRACILPFTVGIEVKQRFFFGNVLTTALEVVRIALTFYLLFGVSKRVLWMVIATVPGGIIENVVIFIYSRRLVPELRFRIDAIRREIVKPLVKFGGAILATRIPAIAREMSLPLFLAHGPKAESAVQASAYRLGGYVETRFYPTVLAPLLNLQPALIGMHAGGMEDRLRRTFFRMSRYLLWTFLAFGVPLSIFHRELWRVWLADASEVYAAGAVVLVLLFAKSFFVFPQPIIASIALARARHGEMAKRVIATELSTIALAYLFARPLGLGAIGIALGTLTATAICVPLLHWTFGLRLTESRFRDFARESILPGLLPALAASPVWGFAWWRLPVVSWWSLGLAGTLGALVYLFVLVRFCLDDSEQRDLRKALSGLRRRLKR